MNKLKSLEILKKFFTSKKYFSLQQVKDVMIESGYSYSDETTVE